MGAVNDNQSQDKQVCYACGAEADAIQRVALRMLERQGVRPRLYCLRCWAKKFPAIAAKQAETEEKITRRKAKNENKKRGNDESFLL